MKKKGEKKIELKNILTLHFPYPFSKVILKPQQDDGLLLYSGHHEYGDFISLCLNMGFVEFTYDLGSGPATLR